MQLEQLKFITNTYKKSQPTYPLSLFENMEMPTLQSIFGLLNSIPNHHKWNCTSNEKASKQQLKFEMRFSSSNRRYPGSPRNRLINVIACPREVLETLILTTLHSLMGILNKDTTTSVRTNIKKLTVPAKKHHRPAFNEKGLCYFLGISPEEANKAAENIAQDFGSSLYQYFSREITANDLIAWRVRSPSIQVIMLNDYVSETGNFKVNLPSRNEWEKSKVPCLTKKLKVIQSNRRQCCINFYRISSDKRRIQNY